ncbi:hypothetical protein BLOT_004758 [Blomia tropicalis]|nr:hypothetical protein BLOT_004758 [Blomia tropicalis]
MESGLAMISRIRSLQHPLDPKLFDNHSEKVLLIHLTDETDELIASRCYVYSLIQTILKVENFPITNVHPSVLIFDGRFFFRDEEFINSIPLSSSSNSIKREQLLNQSRVKIYEAFDDNELLSQLYTNVRVHMAINLNLKLIIIAVNSSIIFPDLFEKVSKFLFSLTITVHSIIITDHLSKSSKQYFGQRNNVSDIIRCKPVKYDQNNIHIRICSRKTRSVAEKKITF